MNYANVIAFITYLSQILAVARAKLVLTLNCHLWIRVVVSQPLIVFYFFLPHLTGLDCVTNWPLSKFDMTYTQSGLNETLCYVQSKVTKQSVWEKKKKKKAKSFFFLLSDLYLSPCHKFNIEIIKN